MSSPVSNRSEEHTSELQSLRHLVCRLLLEKKKAEGAPDIRPLIAEGRNVIGLRTFSKVYGLASLRVGYGYATAEPARLLDRVRQPFNVNAIAQAAAVAALDDREFTRMVVAETRRGLRRLEAGCGELGLEFVPSQSNFLLVRVGDGARVYDALLHRRS